LLGTDHPPDSHRDFANSAGARPNTPPFFFFEKVGREMPVFFIIFYLIFMYQKEKGNLML
jgi:hypothetical protein